MGCHKQKNLITHENKFKTQKNGCTTGVFAAQQTHVTFESYQVPQHNLEALQSKCVVSCLLFSVFGGTPPGCFGVEILCNLL